MKRPFGSLNSRSKKIACTVSASALMLGVSSAATIGLHFQENYCGAPAYSGFLVTLTAFGIAPSSWENLAQMNTGYGSCGGPLGYNFTQVLDTTTSTTNGLNPLPNGSITVNWFGPTANYNPFGGYTAGTPPNYYHPGGSSGASAISNAPVTGEEQIYATFIRDGINFGPPGGPDNHQPGWSIDITGLKSLFPNSSFVVETMASGDSIETLTNVMVIDLANSLTNLIAYPNIPPVVNSEGTSFYQGTGGGLSTGSAAVNADHVQIMSVQPVHVAGEYNHAGTISGFILTDKPLVSMFPQSIPLAGPGDVITLNPYAIGVPPLSFQWQLNGQNIPGATSMTYMFTNTSLADSGSYALVVTNIYGSTTSIVSTVSGDSLVQTPTNSVVYDSNPNGIQHNGQNMGTAPGWVASESDGTLTETGVMDFLYADTNGITVEDAPAFDAPAATIAFWMRSAGTPGTLGLSASIFCRPSTNDLDFILFQNLNGTLGALSPSAIVNFDSSRNVSDNKWHFVALAVDQTAAGGSSLYIDGVLDTTNTNFGASWVWPSGNQPLQIGYSSDPQWISYQGALHDVMYFNTALSTSQINTLFHGTDPDAAALQLQLDFAAPPGTGYSLTWRERSAVLQSAPTPIGPWADIQGVTSPYTIVPAATQQYFRYRYVPIAQVSNPYLM
ncbi:MAG TPA: LamG-like jellyroll fold domain-containing protein [Verrucomicrobiae bacterium]|jgi:hypothetical protein